MLVLDVGNYVLNTVTVVDTYSFDLYSIPFTASSVARPNSYNSYNKETHPCLLENYADYAKLFEQVFKNCHVVQTHFMILCWTISRRLCICVVCLSTS